MNSPRYMFVYRGYAFRKTSIYKQCLDEKSGECMFVNDVRLEKFD